MSGDMRLIYKDELAELREDNKRLRAELEQEREKNRWILCSERLPDDGKYKEIMYRWYGKMYVCTAYCHNGCWISDEWSLMDAVYWRELPEPPEEQQP